MVGSPAHSRPEGTFGQRFVERAATYGPVCVGIDPHAQLMQDWGLEASVDGLRQFTDICVEAFAETACVVKPQVAFYERFGSAGFAVLERALSALRAAGVLVIADAKRGDIGSTMAGYATAWLDDSSPLCADAVTVSPWLGFGSLEPVLQAAEQSHRGAIVLAATSNPEAPSVQLADVRGVTLAQDIVNQVAQRNAAHDGPGNLGVVVGATVDNPPQLDEVGGMILMPGVGAQGGSFADVKRIAGAAEALACLNVSRGVLKHGPDVGKISDAVMEMRASYLK